jgi:O-acetylserine/cysteine efflux transporter
VSLKPVHALLAILVAAIWGFSFVVIKVGVSTVPPLLLTGLRFLFAAFPAILFVRRPKAHFAYVAGYGFFVGVLQFGLLFVAIKQGLPAGLASVVIQSQVFFTIGLAALLFGEKSKPVQIAGALIAIAGIALIAWTRWTGAALLPLLFCLGAAIAWSIANTLSKRSGEKNALSFIVWASLTAPMPLFVLSALTEDHAAIMATLTHPTWLSAISIAFLAWPATILGFGTWSFLLSRYPANQVSPFALLVPVFGLAGGIGLLGEKVQPLALAGSLLVLGGLILTVLGPRIFARQETLP